MVASEYKKLVRPDNPQGVDLYPNLLDFGAWIPHHWTVLLGFELCSWDDDWAISQDGENWRTAHLEGRGGCGGC